MNDVSLWLGCFRDLETLERYTEVKYNEDGDSIPSLFEKDFTLGYYDRDLTEKDWIPEKENDIEKLLVDFSYDEQLIKQFKEIKLVSKYNTIILIYNYKYDKEDKIIYTIDKNCYKLDYIGTDKYIDE